MSRSKQWEADRRAQRAMAAATAETNAWIEENKALGGCCDFCATPFSERKWYATWTTGMPMVGALSGLMLDTNDAVGAATAAMYYSPDWGACDVCDPVVALRDPEKLADHVIRNRNLERLGRLPDDAYDDAESRAELVDLYVQFFERARRLPLEVHT